MTDMELLSEISDALNAFDVGVVSSLDECNTMALSLLHDHDKALLEKAARAAQDWSLEKYPEDLDTSDGMAVVAYIHSGIHDSIMGVLK